MDADAVVIGLLVAVCLAVFVLCAFAAFGMYRERGFSARRIWVMVAVYAALYIAVQLVVRLIL